MAFLRAVLRAPASWAVAGLAAVLLLSASSPAAAGESPPAGQRRPFSFTPHRLDRCRTFPIIEATGSRVTMTTQDAMDQFIVTDGVGLMVNVDPSWAVGGAMELYWARGVVRAAPSVRCRRWFLGEQSAEASLGYLIGHDAIDYAGTQTQLVGPIASVRYSPVSQFFVQGGLCRYREQHANYLPPNYVLVSSSREYTKAFGGVGLSGAGGLAAWSVELLALGVAVALFSGMSS